MHGELATPGITVAASTVWKVLQAEGTDPAPDRATTRADFPHSQADALLARDFIETVTLTGQRQYILAAIEHATRRDRIPGTSAHPTANRAAQAARNLVMDLEDAQATVAYLIRDRNAKYPALFDQIPADAGIQVVLTGIRMPRMNAIMERWVQTCRHEFLHRTLIRNEHHLPRALREYEQHHNAHRPHQTMNQAAPLQRRPRTAGPRTDHPPGHTPHRPPRRSHPRTPTRRLNSTDEVSGRRNVEAGLWDAELESLLLRAGERFRRVEPRRRMWDYVRGLLGPVGRKNSWQLSEHAKRLRTPRQLHRPSKRLRACPP